jgi:hypothetical protein
MSEQQFEQYLADLADHMELSTRDRQRIRAELRAHMEDHLDDLVAQGVPRERAVAQALCEFGEARGLGERFTRVHHRATWSRAVAGLAVLIVATAAWQTAMHALGGNGRSSRTPMLFTAGSAAGYVGERDEHTVVPAEEALDRVIPKVNLVDASLGEAIDFLRDALGCNLWVNWPSLEQQGVDESMAVELKLRDVPARRVLEILCAQISNEGLIVYGVADNVLEIADINEIRATPASEPNELRLYDVRDLVRVDKPGPETDHRPSPNDLLHTIASTVSPTSWGGENATINIFDGQLIVRQTPDNHEMIERLLDELRHRPRASQSGPNQVAADAQAEYVRQMQQIELQSEIQQAQVQLEQARRELQHTQELVQKGMVDDTVEAQAQAHVRMFEIQIDRLHRQMELLEQMRGQPIPRPGPSSAVQEREEISRRLADMRERQDDLRRTIEHRRQEGAPRQELEDLQRETDELGAACESLERQLAGHQEPEARR